MDLLSLPKSSPGHEPPPPSRRTHNLIIVGKPDNPEFTHSMLAACMNLAGRARCIEIAAGAEKRRFRCAKRNLGSTGGSSAQRTVVAQIGLLQCRDVGSPSGTLF